MKNFSVKTADFDSLSISGESPIVQSDLGTAPNQIPLNKDLGSLAYMNAPQIEDINVDTLELREIAAELSETAVDVFVYDTRKDSDGGAWRSRTQHTSWYNEELNTTTRGGRREFPAVAVIVAESDKITIYDGDDPDLNMWMVINQVEWSSGILFRDVVCVNATMVIGSGSGITVVNFINNKMSKIHPAAIYTGDYVWGELLYNPPVLVNYGLIIHNAVNDVAMTVLPNAPIDTETGLPIPTIAVATDGGVSVIRNDGSVVDITVNNASFSYAKNVNFTTNNDFITVIGGSSSHDYIFVFDGIPDSDNVMTIDSRTGSSQDARSMFRKMPLSNDTIFDGFTVGSEGSQNQMIQTIQGDRFACGNDNDGLTIIDDNDLGFKKKNLAYISSSYNTGWMPGDIKLATLSDTKIEKVGVDESTDLVTNGKFNSDYTGWYGESADLTNANHPDSGSNSLLVTPTASVGFAIQDLTTVSGQKYVLSADIAFGAGCTKITIADNSGAVINEDYLVAGGNRTVIIDFDGNASMSNLQLIAYGGPAYFDNVSIKQTGELITNGTFDDGTVGWTEISDPTLTVADNKLNLKCLNGDNQAGVWQNISANDPSQKYILSFDIGSFVGDTAANLMVSVNDYFNGAATTGNVEVFSGKENGSYSFGFNGRPAGVMIFFRIYDITGPCSGDTSINISNISVRLAEDDRSVNDNGLQVFGEIEKTPVAPGADLVAYSGFSADDYLMQPYNSDLDFGTGDFSIMGWFKNANNLSTLLARMLPQVAGTIGTDRGFSVAFTTSNKLRFSIYTRGFNSTQGRTVLDSDDNKTEINTWTHFVVTREGGKIKFYFNGKKQASETANSDDISDNTTSVPLSVGCFNETPEYGFTGSVALIRISATVPTSEQIAKIYRDEKPLFQDGAQSTLYGTSDAVTALAYDDSENLLHVGTASGRSAFNGLKRVENTDVAVTTAISAKKGFVIAQ